MLITKQSFKSEKVIYLLLISHYFCFDQVKKVQMQCVQQNHQFSY